MKKLLASAALLATVATVGLSASPANAQFFGNQYGNGFGYGYGNGYGYGIQPGGGSIFSRLLGGGGYSPYSGYGMNGYPSYNGYAGYSGYSGYPGSMPPGNAYGWHRHHHHHCY